MENSREICLLLRGLQKGLIDPNMLAEEANGWTPESEPSFLRYLTRRGVITEEQRILLETDFQLEKSSHVAPVPEGPTVVYRTNGNGKRHSSTNHSVGTKSQEAPVLQSPGDDLDNATTQDEQSSRISEFIPPKLPSRYENLRTYRRGGVGQIWIARDTKIGRDVALKSLRRDQKPGKKQIARFIREAEITGQLEHPCIVPLYDLDQTSEGDASEPYYTMRFVSGRTFHEAIHHYHEKRQAQEGDRLELPSLLDTFVVVCRAVAFAHSRDILHRDLKGQNIILGDFGEVFLLDWGLGKKVDEAEPGAIDEIDRDNTQIDDTLKTTAGAVIGTPSYMAPEVAAGKSATKASDIYSLGAILYTILTGQPPVRGTSVSEIIDQIVKKDLPSAKERDPSVPPGLDAICAKAMARDPNRRYQSAEELALEVRRWLADEPIQARRDCLSVRAFRWAKRNRTLVVSSFVFLLCLSSALTISTGLIWKEERRTAAQQLEALKNFQLARDLSYGDIDLIMSSESYFARSPARSRARKKILVASSAAYREFLKKDPEDKSLIEMSPRLYRYTANVHRSEYEVREASKLYEEALGILKEFRKREPENIAYRSALLETQLDWGQLLVIQGKNKEAREISLSALEMAEELAKEQPEVPSARRESAFALLNLSGIEEDLGLEAEARKHAERAIEIFRAMSKLKLGEGGYELDPLLTAMAWTKLAALHLESGRDQESAESFSSATLVFRPLLEENKTQINEGDVLFQVSRMRLERAKLFVKDPERGKEALAMLNAVIHNFDYLAKDFPERPMYKQFLANALRILAGFPPKIVDAEVARMSFKKSAADLKELSQKYPDVPPLLGELGQTQLDWSLFEKRAGNKERAAELLNEAATNLTDAANKCPDSAIVQKSLAIIKAEKAK